jgi:hypothetical protein
MGIKSRANTGTKPGKLPPKPAKTEAAPADKATKTDATDEVAVRHHYGWSVSRHLTLRVGDGEYVKFGVTAPAETYEEAAKLASDAMMQEAEAAVSSYNTLRKASESVVGNDAADEGAADHEEAEIGPDQVNAMSRDQLIELVTSNSLEIDPDEYPNNKKGLQALRDAIIAVAFGDEDTSGDADADNVLAKTSDGDEGGDAEEEVTKERVMAMKRDELLALIDANGLEIDPDEFPKLAELRAAVVAVAFDEGDGDGDDATDADANGDDDNSAYTREQLDELDLDDLKTIWKEWEMPGKFPPGPPNIAKKMAISQILKYQDANS